MFNCLIFLCSIQQQIKINLLIKSNTGTGQRTGTNLKTSEDLSKFEKLLKTIIVEAALNTEMTHHSGYEKNKPKPGAHSPTIIPQRAISRAAYMHDRNVTFEAQLVKENQTRMTGMDNQILSLHAREMTTREVVTALKEQCDANVSPAQISTGTDVVMEQIAGWQICPQDAVIPLFALTV